jgi:hypothetical protein
MSSVPISVARRSKLIRHGLTFPGRLLHFSTRSRVISPTTSPLIGRPIEPGIHWGGHIARMARSPGAGRAKLRLSRGLLCHLAYDLTSTGLSGSGAQPELRPTCAGGFRHPGCHVTLVGNRDVR